MPLVHRYRTTVGEDPLVGLEKLPEVAPAQARARAAVDAAYARSDRLVGGDEVALRAAVASAALAVCRRVGDPEFLESVRSKGARIERLLEELVAERPGVTGARGAGMIWGLLVEEPAGDVVARAREARLLLCPAGPKVVRILPPLTISDEDLDRGLDILSSLL